MKLDKTVNYKVNHLRNPLLAVEIWDRNYMTGGYFATRGINYR